MKLASLADGSRDGRLTVVSDDLTRLAPADRVAPTLQAALDDWAAAAPRLAELAAALEAGRAAEAEPCNHDRLMAPLPNPRP